ncbi:RHS repeat protein [bacterium]|nr:RHS repeat protein [bacterium]
MMQFWKADSFSSDLIELTKLSKLKETKSYFRYDNVGRLMHKLYDNGAGVGDNYYAVCRLRKKTLTNGRYISYTYDSSGRRTQMRDYFGGQTTYSYDALGRLVSIVNPYGEMTTFQYDANSRLIRKNLPNGTYTTYSYNSRGFLLGIANYKSNGTLITYANYTYDAVGNRLSMTTPEGTYSYTYDAIYRLTGEVNPIGGNYSYTYDGVGNRLTMTHNGVTTNYTYDAGNKLLQAGATTFTYDGNGNMVSKTENGQTTTYVYNYEDKMIQVNLPGGATINYSYDHEGKRIGKTAGGITTDYYFDGDDLIIEAQGTNILAYYTQGQGLISQRRNNLSYFYHYDGLGSTKALTDVNQNIQSSYKYDAWGNILQSSGSITNPYLYVGELGYYADGDAGMYLLTQRWYNPVVGRFVVRDPLRGKGMNSDIDFYSFVRNMPVGLTDPSGLKEKCPTWKELPRQSLKCYFQCLGIEWSSGNPHYYLDLGCLKKCLGKKMERNFAEFICCSWWKYIYLGEEPSRDPWIKHPCEKEEEPYTLAACERCCDFEWCICQVSSFATPEGGNVSGCGIFWNKCYWECAAKECPKIFGRKQ